MPISQYLLTSRPPCILHTCIKLLGKTVTDSFRRTYDKLLKARKPEESRPGLQETFVVLTKLVNNSALLEQLVKVLKVQHQVTYGTV
jgi:hypothetical protein